MLRVEDEGDGRNDVRVAHARPIVAKEPVELPSGHGERVKISAFRAVPACDSIKKVFSRGDFGG